MKALIRDRYGLPDVLEVREVQTPVPKEHEVLVRVHAVSINDWDWGLLQGPEHSRSATASPRADSRIRCCRTGGRGRQCGGRRFQPGDEVYGDLTWLWQERVGWVCGVCLCALRNVR